MNTKHLTLLLTYCLLSIGIHASDENKFSVHIVDYSLSWISSMHYYFDNEGIKVEEVDNVDNKKNVVYTRKFTDTESDLTYKYLTILTQIKFQKEYIKTNASAGERNQKRINIKVRDVDTSIFISNVYQQDIAGFITFLNSFIDESHKMKEFVDPAKPAKKRNR